MKKETNEALIKMNPYANSSKSAVSERRYTLYKLIAQSFMGYQTPKHYKQKLKLAHNNISILKPLTNDQFNKHVEASFKQVYKNYQILTEVPIEYDPKKNKGISFKFRASKKSNFSVEDINEYLLRGGEIKRVA